MRLLIAILLSIAPAAAGGLSMPDPQLAKPPQPTATAGCRLIMPYYAYREGRPLKLHNLNELPPAHAFSAVFRQIGGCEAPIVIKYSVGGQ